MHPPPTFVRAPVRAVLLAGAFLAAWGGSPQALGSDRPQAPPAATSARPRDRDFWSFRTPEVQPRPLVRNRRWPRQPVDYFVLARLERHGRIPAITADKRTLLRRISFDLTGLPPTPPELEAFLTDTRPDAYERVVERLLASPRFGERMASVWLPLARYAEDQAHQVGSDTTMFYPNAHLYRAWVIDAFNRDLPYDRFLQLQLAADRIEPTNSPHLAALGFLGLGPKYYNRGRLDVMADEWEDRVDTVSRTMLALTVGCARCHDHKFEPISMEDYYALAGVFASTRLVNRTPAGKVIGGKMSADKFPADAMHVVEDGETQDLNLFRRGNVENKGPVVERRFLRLLCPDEPVKFTNGSGRVELAAAIATPVNPLTARVMVNRLWGLAFGTPLVATPSNFGHSGQAPTYPELLDDLAARFARHWSVKSALRELVLSATYRQGSGPGDDAETRPGQGDDEPVLHGMPRRRLTIEQWRDAVLFVTGEVDFAGGPSEELEEPGNFRRTVYARISRLKLDDVLMQFDYPDANVHAEKRARTTTPMQKLFLLNHPFILSRAIALATRLDTEVGTDDRARVRRAYQWLFTREPQAHEVELALEFLSRPAEDVSRWVQYTQILLASNEAFYVD